MCPTIGSGHYTDSGLYYDPLWGYIPLPQLIRSALDLKGVQRLRRIKQLATLDLVFAGATHSRFEHTVGTYHLATNVFDRIFDQFIEVGDSEQWPKLGHVPKLALQLAAIFHDVGHGPFSHFFEFFCKRHTAYQRIDHESMSVTLICKGVGRYDDIPGFLKDVSDRHKRDPNHELLLPENIARIATGKPLPGNLRDYSWLGQVIAGDFGVDRMDYLCRDAFHTGVGTGLIDIWEILHHYTLAKDGQYEDGSPMWRAFVSIEAAHALEGLLAARDFAYRRIYYHPTHRAAQEMVIRALHEISEDYPEEELAILADEELLARFLKGSSLAKNVGTGLIDRDLYEPLPVEINVYRDLDDNARKQLSEYNSPLSTEMYKQMLDKIRKISGKIKLRGEEELMFDLASIPYAKRAAFVLHSLYDPADGSTRSLLDVLPHLQLHYGTFTLSGNIQVEIGKVLFQQLSNLLILVPRHYVRKCIQEYRDQHPEAKSAEIVEEVYKQFLLPIIEGYVEFMGFSDADTRKRLIKKFESSTKNRIASRIN